MERHATSAELKARAKGKLLGKYGTIIPAILIVEIIMFAITSVITLPLDTRTMPGLIAVSYTHLDVYKRQGSA